MYISLLTVWALLQLTAVMIYIHIAEQVAGGPADCAGIAPADVLMYVACNTMTTSSSSKHVALSIAQVFPSHLHTHTHTHTHNTQHTHTYVYRLVHRPGTSFSLVTYTYICLLMCI